MLYPGQLLSVSPYTIQTMTTLNTENVSSQSSHLNIGFTYFSLAWESDGAPADLLLYIVVGSFSAVIKTLDLALCGLSGAEAASEVSIPLLGRDPTVNRRHQQNRFYVNYLQIYFQNMLSKIFVCLITECVI